MDIKPAQFATPEFPIRASSLPGLVQCMGSVLMDPVIWEQQIVDDDEDGGGMAAQTGSLVHAAADIYHRFQGASEAQRTEAGLSALEDARKKFPQGRADKATKQFLAYAADPDNLEANVIHNESRVTFEIPCASFDPTGLPVYIHGTLDQVRLEKDGRRTLWDIKTGEFYYGKKALDHYLLQQAAYVIGARSTYQEDIEPGGLICTYGYVKKPAGQVFWAHQWNTEDAASILFPVVVNVAAARSGKALMNPGDRCKWCVHKNQTNCRMVARAFNLL